MNKYRRASLRARLHFLFTGEIKGYWYLASRVVFSTYVTYLMTKYPELKEKEGFDKESFGAITNFLNNPGIPFRELKPYIQRFEKCNSLPNVIDLFSNKEIS